MRPTICLLLAALVAGQEPRFRDRGLSLANGPTSWGDVNGDGWVDLNAGGQLWQNKAGEGFERVADVTPGLFGDFDGDGNLDLFGFAGQTLLRGDGKGGFTPVDLGSLTRTVSSGAALGDFNGDGHLDAYVGGYESWGDNITYPDHLLLGDGKTLKLGWSDARYRARGVTACDYDTDGDLDVYVSNYRLQPNVLWRNDSKGQLEDVAAATNTLATSEGFGGGHAIGASWGDFDGDGRFDLFAGNFAHVDSRGDQPKSRFLRGQEDGTFEDMGTCGVFYQESYASPAAGDFDNDGDLDLFFTTVYEVASFGRSNNPVLYRNDGGWEFTDVTEQAGLAGLPATYQASWADFDKDGDLDLVTAGKLFENTGPCGRSLRVQASEAPVIGAQVRARVSSGFITRQVEAGTGQGNGGDLALHLGLGGHEGVIELEVRWPATQSLASEVQTVLVPEGAGEVLLRRGDR